MLAIHVLALLPVLASAGREFTVDRQKNCFRQDGKCVQLISGSMHYIRAPEELWEDRISKFRAAGLNTLQTYVPWFFHAPYPGKFHFSGRSNITKFIQLTQKYGLNLVLRAGPYMCAEVDFGGLPWWLLKEYPDIKVRTSDKRFMMEVEKYYNALFPLIKPHLYVNGGNIISVQVENEYGSFHACDKVYMKSLRDLFRKHLGDKVLLFTTDGNSEGYLKCGATPDVFPTVDFGVSDKTSVTKSFQAQQNYSKGGPNVNSEFYPGWLDQWGDPHHHTVSKQSTIDTMDYMWSHNASFNIYMFFGGTNFGYMNGAEGSSSSYGPITTSYDYDAPISECGDVTAKWAAIRKAVEKHTGKTVPYPVPKPGNKYELDTLPMKRMGSIYDFINVVGQGAVKSTYPVNVEQINHPYGFTLYQTTIGVGLKGTHLNITGVHDRAYIIKNNNELLGITQRPETTHLVLREPLAEEDLLSILVENQGRICYGSYMNDTKGLVSNVTLDGKILTKFTIYPINLQALASPMSEQARRKRSTDEVVEAGATKGFIPSFYEGILKPDVLADTFLDPSGWGKGQALINAIDIGRYWPDKGPQVRLYVPGVYLKNSTRVILFELEKDNCGADGDCSISFHKEHKFKSPAIETRFVRERRGVRRHN